MLVQRCMQKEVACQKKSQLQKTMHEMPPLQTPPARKRSESKKISQVQKEQEMLESSHEQTKDDQKMPPQR